MTDRLINLSPYIAPTLLSTLLENPNIDTPVAERFQAAVMFADVSGFTPLTEALAQKGSEGTEELTRLLNTYFQRIISIIEHDGGEIAKFSGDALTVLFCAMDGHLDQATRRAFQSATKLQAAMPEFAALETSVGTTTLGLKIAIGAGNVIAMQVGGVFNRWEYVVGGDPLRQVAEIEGGMTRGEVQLSQEAQAIIAPGPVSSVPIRVPDWSCLTNPDLVEASMRRFIPGSLIGWLQEGMQEWLAVLRPMGVLFMGVGGLDYDTDDALESLHNLVGTVQKTAYRYEGSLNKVVVDDKGTVLLLLFGAPPLAHQDDPLRAVRCALEIQEHVLSGELQNLEGRVAIGIASGRVFAGPVGSDRRREYTVMGDTVNLAARLMGKAGAGAILCEVETYRQAHNRLAFETLAPIRLKGKAGLIRVYRPLVESEASRRTADSQKRLHQAAAWAFVGRHAELATLKAMLQHLQQGQGHTVIIQGEAGIGKSRLVLELSRMVHERGLISLTAAGQSTEQQTPYRAWRDIFITFFDLETLTESSQRQERVRRVVQELAPEHMARLPLLSDLLKLDLSETELTASLDPALRQQNLSLLMVTLLRAWARERPLFIIIEDAHWLDSLSWDLTLQVVRNLHAAEAPMLLTLVTRPVDTASLAGTHLATLRTLDTTRYIPLGELSTEETISLVTARLGLPEGELPAPVAELVALRAGGNPFFAEELVFTLRDQGIITIEPAPIERQHTTRRFNRCRITSDLHINSLALPDTIQGLVLARMDRLPPELQLTLKVSAVIGRLFPYIALKYTLNRHTIIDDKTLKDYLDALVALEMTPIDTPEPELTYVFKHSITRDVAYQTLLFTQRRALHRTVAEWYEVTYGNANNGHGERDTREPLASVQPGELLSFEAWQALVKSPALAPYYPLLVHHYYHADDRERERTCAHLAGEHAAAQFANTEAVNYLSRALELTTEEEQLERYALLLARERVYSLQGEREVQQHDLTALHELAEALDDNRCRIEVALREANYADVTGDFPAVISAAQHAIELAAHEQDVSSEAEGHLLWGMSLQAQGDYQSAQEQLELSLTLTCVSQVEHANQPVHPLPNREARLLTLEARSLLNLGNVAADQGNSDEARSFYEHSLRVCREIGDRLGESKALGNLGVVAADQGNYSEARTHYEQDLRLCREIGNRLGESVTLNNLGSVASSQGDYEQARAYYEQSLELCREIDDLEGESFGLSGLGMLLHQVGDHATSLVKSQHAMRLTEKTGDRNTQADVLTNMGNALAALERLDEATVAYQSAFDLRQELGQESKAAESLAGLARVALARGDIEQASSHVEHIIQHLEQGLPQGTYEPFRIYLTCYQVLKAQNDPRALAWLKTAHTLLHEQAARMGDEAMQHSFLHHVPAHRCILQELNQGFFFLSREVGSLAWV